MNEKNKPTTIDEYIAPFPDEVKTILEEIRALVHELAPEATEALSYGIPTFKINGKILVHFAGFKKHIGFYPTPTGIERFAEELSAYEGGKGSVKFPLNQPVPYDLIQKIVIFRVNELTE